jgi:hypothetical protein
MIDFCESNAVGVQEENAYAETAFSDALAQCPATVE